MLNEEKKSRVTIDQQEKIGSAIRTYFSVSDLP